MKKLLLFAAAAGIMTFSGCTGIQAPEGYSKLIWHDEFDENALDTAKWERVPLYTKGKVPDWRIYTSLRPDLAQVKDGNLILTGVKNDDLKADARPYLQGQVWSKGKFSFFRGMVEIRAKFEDQHGAWPAFWMLPDKGKWPDGGEIDIMERLHSDDFVYQTCHSKWTHTMKQKTNPPHYGKAPIRQGEYNVYGVEWTPDALIWSVNGKETFRYPRTGSDPAQWPYDSSPFYLILDMQLGGAWVKTLTPDPATLPVHVYIDYVRVWQK